MEREVKSNYFTEQNLQMAQELTVLGPPGAKGEGRGIAVRTKTARIPFLQACLLDVHPSLFPVEVQELITSSEGKTVRFGFQRQEAQMGHGYQPERGETEGLRANLKADYQDPGSPYFPGRF